MIYHPITALAVSSAQAMTSPCVRLCVRVCVRERGTEKETERVRDRQRKSEREGDISREEVSTCREPHPSKPTKNLAARGKMMTDECTRRRVIAPRSSVG